MTPLCATTWERGLSDHPDRQFVELLCTGIQESFCVGFNYREHQCRKASRNMRSVREHREVVEEYIHKEREAGRLLGPFQPNAFPEVQVNPFLQVCRFLQVALKVCKDSGFPVAEEKQSGQQTLITLLGIELDSERLELRLPPGKLTKLCELVGKWRRRMCYTKRELQSLVGHLNHACKVVRPGRRGVFGLLSQFRRPDHQTRLNAAFRADLEWWHTFVSLWNGVSMMLRESLRLPGVVVWSDASGSWGCGAYWGNQWCQVPWSGWGLPQHP